MSDRRQILAELVRLELNANATVDELRAFVTARQRLLETLRALPPAPGEVTLLEQAMNQGAMAERFAVSQRETVLERLSELARARRQIASHRSPPRGSRLRRKG